ncbi:hypothetical protein D3C72_1905700 [compost metagenome]
MHQGDAKYLRGFLFHLAFLSHRAQDGDARAHALNKLIGYRFVDGDQILFLVIVASTEDLIDQFAVIGQENQPLGVFIQAPDRKDASAVINEITNVIPHVLPHAGNDANRLVQCDKHQIVRTTGFDLLAVNFHHIPGQYLSAHGG